MKKSYETPSIEVVKFQYRDQVVAASGKIPEGRCYGDWVGMGEANSGNCHTEVIVRDLGL